MSTAPRPIAAIITEWRRLSHADVILSRILEPENWGHVHPFGLKLAAVYADQFPEGTDLCRDYCRRHNVPIFPTIKGAVGVGSDRVAVDGVLLIGEHGNYPRNSRHQQIYPRRRLFEGIVDAFRRLGRRVPVFNDKHLSYDWLQARWMYDLARHEGIPLMAGSSLPVAWRTPHLQIPLGSELTSAVAVGYGDADAYGFHALEALQCMVERRHGEETGVDWVQSFTGPSMDRLIRQDSATRELFESVIRIRHGDRLRLGTFQARDRESLWRIQYHDGLPATVGMFQGFGPIFGYAGRRNGNPTPDAFIDDLEEGRYFGHFGYLLRAVERMIQSGTPSYPVERTLLTTGMLAASIQSMADDGSRIPTPHLTEVRYQPKDWPIAPDPLGKPA